MQPASQNGSSKLQSRWILDRPLLRYVRVHKSQDDAKRTVHQVDNCYFAQKSSYIWPYYHDNALRFDDWGSINAETHLQPCGHHIF